MKFSSSIFYVQIFFSIFKEFASNFSMSQRCPEQRKDRFSFMFGFFLKEMVSLS